MLVALTGHRYRALMAHPAEFILDLDVTWQILDGASLFAATPGATALRDFLLPLAKIARGRFAMDELAVAQDGDGVSFSLGGQPFTIRCRDLRLSAFVTQINEALTAAGLEYQFAIVESQRYELRGALLPSGARTSRLARGTLPP